MTPIKLIVTSWLVQLIKIDNSRGNGYPLNDASTSISLVVIPIAKFFIQIKLYHYEKSSSRSINSIVTKNEQKLIKISIIISKQIKLFM